MEEKRDIISEPYKVLIVDDDPLVLKTLERLLYQERYLFYSVNTGEQALGAIQEIQPDIVLLDVLMPGINGYDVCAELQRNPKTQSLPVVFLTSNQDPEDIIKGFEAGAVDYITKPFNKAELLIRLKTHLQLKSAKEEIRESNLIKTKFFSIMTNDIRDTLIGVKGVANFLHQELQANGDDNNEALKLSQILLKDSSYLYKLLENLIEWAYIEIEAKHFAPEEINLGSITNKVLDELDGMREEKLIRVKKEFDESINILADPKAMHTVLIRVIHNALKYSYKGNEVVIEAHKKDGLTQINITDFGVGMDGSVVENIFRLDTPHPKSIGTNQEKGTGLGLIICKTLIEKMKGSIFIESQKHKGAKVSISLPDMLM